MSNDLAPGDRGPGDDAPPRPALPFEPGPPSGEPAPQPGTSPSRPAWSYFLAPLAILAGSFVIASAVWFTRSDDDPGAPAALPVVDAASTVRPASTAAATSLLALFNAYAKEVGIDAPKFEQCLGKQATAQLINAHLNRGGALGVNGTPTFVINNKLIVGAQPAAIFDEVIAAELRGSPASLDGYSAAIAELAAAGRFKILDGPVDISDATIEGDRNARVMVAEFSDFQCPFCKRWTDQNIRRLRPQFGKDLALAFLHFPIIQIHPNAGNASAAAICAGEQGKFWPMHDLLFARQAEWENLR